MRSPRFLVVDPAYFEVAYAINPWMNPGLWDINPEGLRLASRIAFTDLSHALRSAGATLEILSGVKGVPDLVFPANAAIVLDGRAILARFRHPERQLEEPIFRKAFDALKQRGLLREVAELPQGQFQEGAGDFIWDETRRLFWAGHGPRSSEKGAASVTEFFGEEVAMLELATERFYHLDTCFCPLPGGELLYYPPAFTAAALRTIKDHVPAWQLIEASDEDATRFCVNAVGIDRTIIMAEAADGLRGILTERGYSLAEVNLAPFILSGGGAYCMTLRLDRESNAAAEVPSLAISEPAP